MIIKELQSKAEMYQKTFDGVTNILLSTSPPISWNQLIECAEAYRNSMDFLVMAYAFQYEILGTESATQARSLSYSLECICGIRIGARLHELEGIEFTFKNKSNLTNMIRQASSIGTPIWGVVGIIAADMYAQGYSPSQQSLQASVNNSSGLLDKIFNQEKTRFTPQNIIDLIGQESGVCVFDVNLEQAIMNRANMDEGQKHESQH